MDITHADMDTRWILKQLSQHPLVKAGIITPPQMGEDTTQSPSQGQGEVDPSTGKQRIPDPKQEEEEKKKLAEMMMQMSFSNNGDGWFVHIFGDDADRLVKNLREKRRVHKQLRDEIDEAIQAIRIMKRLEVERTLHVLPWVDQHRDTIDSIGLNDRDLKALRKFGPSREISLRQACLAWEGANEIITKLSQIETDWDGDQRGLWVEAMKKRDGARRQWSSTLHQADILNKTEAIWLNKAVDVLQQGPLSSRDIVGKMLDVGAPKKGLSTSKIGQLMKTYGPEYDIVKIHRQIWGVAHPDGGIIFKDLWAYAAGFLDADGYITITKRGEPRAGIIATGERGRIHCEQLHKSLNCGVLQLNLKVHKNSKRSQHRLQFYSAADLKKLLKGVGTHLCLKRQQADAVLEYLELRGRDGDLISKRRSELERLVKWCNWSDVKGPELLVEWGVDEADIAAWGQTDPELIRLVDDAERITEVI
jgi:hypothetical protein